MRLCGVPALSSVSGFPSSAVMVSSSSPARGPGTSLWLPSPNPQPPVISRSLPSGPGLGSCPSCDWPSLFSRHYLLLPRAPHLSLGRFVVWPAGLLPAPWTDLSTLLTPTHALPASPHPFPASINGTTACPVSAEGSKDVWEDGALTQGGEVLPTIAWPPSSLCLLLSFLASEKKGHVK